MNTSVFISDEEAMKGFPKDITLRALTGRAVVWFLPFRRSEGVIEIAEQHRPDSAEGVIVHDNTAYGLKHGTRVAVSRIKGDGKYFDVGEHKFCTVGMAGLLAIDTKASPTYAEEAA